MSNLNKATIMGRLGNDPEVRHTQGGTTVTNISVATTERWKDKDGERQEKTEWHRVVFFGKVADIAGEYLRKGHLVYLEGRLETEKWTDNNGVDRFTTKIIADELKLFPKGDGERSQGQQQRREQPTGRQTYGDQSGPKRDAPPKQNDFGDDFADDDIPF